jgi:hypothetical protein
VISTAQKIPQLSGRNEKELSELKLNVCPKSHHDEIFPVRKKPKTVTTYVVAVLINIINSSRFLFSNRF